MRSLRYLNSVLTVIAVLLTLNVYTLWTMPQSGAAVSVSTEAQAAGLPNPGAQRQQMIDLLKKLSKQAEETKGLFKSGQARVRVEAGR